MGLFVRKRLQLSRGYTKIPEAADNAAMNASCVVVIFVGDVELYI
jgi:hypothetical protein